ncbi:adhesion G-protein coupled receptor G6-like [Amphiura filiformis]|uniref:adhesion G-protein coupled receptor G6-like n=1 Tax=Amphiura filiformis TaxID=82378 RepID=UPI003B2117B3
MAIFLMIFAFIVYIQLVGSMEDTSVCSTTTSYSQPYEENFTELYKQIYYEPCGVNDENKCIKYRIIYRLSQRTSHRTIYQISYMCCKGWTMEDDVCKPICIPKCSYGGQCIRPNVCEYPPVKRPIMTMVRRSTDECSTSMRVIPTSHVCEHSTFHLACDSDESISITSALYGRQINGSRCSGPIITTSCAANNSFDVVSQRCNGSRTCNVSASNEVFGDPCVGTYKYLDIDYSCEGQCCPRCENDGNCTRPNHCQCPTGYTGDRCVLPRCMDIITNTSNGLLSWPQTLVGVVVDSKERCPVNTERRNFGLASRECVYNSTYGAMWSAPMVNHCGQVETPKVEDLVQITVDERNVKEVAETLANITKVNSNIKSAAIDINAIQEAFLNVINVGSSSPEVTEAVIEIVDNILSTNISSEWSDDSANAASMVLKAVEQQIAQTLKEHGKFTSVQLNIVVEAFTVDATNSKEGVSFAVNFQAGQQITTNINEDVTSSILLPYEALFNNRTKKGTKVSFISYNQNNLFRSRMLGKQNMTIVSGPVISAVVLGETFTNLDKPVVVAIFPSKVKEVTPSVLNSSVCVFWDFNQNNRIGDWSQEGCERIDISSGKITCHCNHLTNFAVLVDISGHHEQTAFSLVLDMISKLGCVVSIASLCFTLVILLLSRRLRQTLPRKILIQFCLSMLCLYLVFLVGIDSKSGQGCLVVAGLLHYFVLTTVFWMGIEARNMYINLVTVFDVEGSTFLRKAACFAWGVPVIPVAIVMVVKWGDYVADAFCFLAPGYGLYFGLLLPVATVIIHNAVIFTMVMTKLLKSSVGGNVKNSRKTMVRQRLRNAFSISVLLGLTWIFGFLAINKAKRAFQLMFCLSNSFQGVLVFILFCLLQDDVRNVLVENCSRRKQYNVSSGRSKKSDASSHELVLSINTSIEAGTSNLTFNKTVQADSIPNNQRIPAEHKTDKEHSVYTEKISNITAEKLSNIT